MKTMTIKNIDFNLQFRNQCAIDATKKDEPITLTVNELQHIITEAAMYGNDNHENYEKVKP